MISRLAPFWVKLDVLLASSFFYPAACSLAALTCYLPLLSKEISIANFGVDGGELVAAAAVRGIGHPTGYPAYLLILQGFLALPGPSPYWKASLLSAAAAALAVFLVCWIARKAAGSTRNPVILAGPLALIGSQWFASQAVIAEVNTLNVAFVLMLMAWALKIPEWQIAGKFRKRFFLLPLICGFGLGNHLSTSFALLPVAWEYARLIIHKQKVGWSVQQAAGVVCGLFIYAYLPLAARSYPPVNWGNPQSLPGFWWLVSARPYQGMLFSLPGEEFLGRLVMIVKMMVGQFSVPGILAAMVGFWRLDSSTRLNTSWIFFAFIFFSASYGSNDSIVYLLPAWAVLALWLAVGAYSITGVKVNGLALGWWLVVSGVIAFGIIGIGTENRNLLLQIDPQRDQETEKFIRAFDSLPANAIVITSADADSFPLWYDQLALGRRPDLKIVVLSLTRYIWYQETLRHTYPDLGYPNFREWNPGNRLWGDELPGLNPDLPVCRTDIEGSIRVMRCNDQIFYQGKMLQEGWK